MSEEFATYNLITVIAERIIVNDFHLIWGAGSSGVMDGIWLVKKTKNLCGKIPVVDDEVDCPDWEDVANLIDKKEMRLSRLSDTNDYFSEPILKTYGLANLPSKETVGKELNFGIYYRNLSKEVFCLFH